MELGLWSRHSCSLHFLFAVLVSVLWQGARGVNISPVPYNLIPPPALIGKLSSNNVLYDAERLLEGKLVKPHSYATYGDPMYAVTANGLVVNVAPCTPTVVANLQPPGCQSTGDCGQLMSIRVTPEKQLLVLDAYRGLFEINPLSGAHKLIYSTSTPVNNRKSLYLNDFVLLNDGKIIFSEPSTRFTFDNEFYIRFEGAPNGRLLSYNPSYSHTKEELTGLAYPTGLELTDDGSAILLSEAGRARILKIDISEERRFFNSTIWIANLPGMPEHIRASGRGTYWVGLTYARYSGAHSVMDQYANNPQARSILARRRTLEQLKAMYHKRGLAIELDMYGKIASSLHDPTASKVAEVFEVRENFGFLYVGTYDQSAMIRVTLPNNYKPELNVEAVLQVQRSRCKVREENIESARRSIQQKIALQRSGGAKPAARVPTGIAPGPALPPGIPGAAGHSMKPAHSQVNSAGAYAHQSSHNRYGHHAIGSGQNPAVQMTNPVNNMYRSNTQSGPLSMFSQQQGGSYYQNRMSSRQPYNQQSAPMYGQAPPPRYYPQAQNAYGLNQGQYGQNGYRQHGQMNGYMQNHRNAYKKPSTPPKNPAFPHGVDPFSAGPPVVLQKAPEPYNERTQQPQQVKRTPPKPQRGGTFSKIKFSLGKIRDYLKVAVPKPSTPKPTTPKPTTSKPGAPGNQGQTSSLQSMSPPAINDQFFQAALGGFLGTSIQDSGTSKGQNTFDKPAGASGGATTKQPTPSDIYHPSSPESMGSSSPVEAPPMLFGSISEMGLSQIPGQQPTSSDVRQRPNNQPAQPQSFNSQAPSSSGMPSQQPSPSGVQGPPQGPFSSQGFNTFTGASSSSIPNQQVPQTQSSSPNSNQPQSNPSSFASFTGDSNQVPSPQNQPQQQYVPQHQQITDTSNIGGAVPMNTQTKTPTDLQGMQQFKTSNQESQAIQNQAQPKEVQQSPMKPSPQNPALPSNTFNPSPNAQSQAQVNSATSSGQPQNTMPTSFSGAAAIHPKQSQAVSMNSFVGDSVTNKETMGQSIPPNNGLAAQSNLNNNQNQGSQPGAQPGNPSTPANTEAGPKGFIQIYTGPGEYVMIPLSQANLLDILKSGSIGNEATQSQTPPQPQHQGNGQNQNNNAPTPRQISNTNNQLTSFQGPSQNSFTGQNGQGLSQQSTSSGTPSQQQQQTLSQNTFPMSAQQTNNPNTNTFTGQMNQPGLSDQPQNQLGSWSTHSQSQPVTTSQQNSQASLSSNPNDNYNMQNNQRLNSNHQQSLTSNHQQYQPNSQPTQLSTQQQTDPMRLSTPQNQQSMSQSGQTQFTGQYQPQSTGQYTNQGPQNQQQPTGTSWSQFNDQQNPVTNQFNQQQHQQQQQQQQQQQPGPSVTSWTQPTQGSSPPLTNQGNIQPSPTPKDLERLSQNVPQWSLSQPTTSHQGNSFSSTNTVGSQPASSYQPAANDLPTSSYQSSSSVNGNTQPMGSYSSFGPNNQQDALNTQSSGGDGQTGAYVATWQASSSGSVQPQSSLSSATGR